MAGGVALTSALLVRHGRGFIEVTDAAAIARYGRVEGHLSLGALIDPKQINDQCQAFLALSSQLQLTTTATIEPLSSADTPYQGFGMGDTIGVPAEDGTPSTERVVSMNVSEDSDGFPVFAVELGVAAVLHEQRLQHWLTKMLNGTLAGTATSASPVFPPPPAQPANINEILSFHQPGHDSTGGVLLLETGESDGQPVNKSGILYKVVVFVDGPLPGFGTGPTVLTVYVNHVSIGTVTVLAGTQSGVAYFATPVKAALNSAPDVVSVNFTTVDGVAFGGHVDVSIQ